MNPGQQPLPLPRRIKGKRPAFHENAAIDRLIAMLLALTSEVSVLRDRLETVEALGQASGWLGRDAVDCYVPDTAERVVREARREATIARVLAVLQTEIADIAAQDGDYWQIIETIERGTE